LVVVIKKEKSMNILLRKLWIVTSLMLVANAEIVFDLNAQQFQNAIGKDANGQNADKIETPSRYNLPKTYVSTGLIYKDGTYTLENNQNKDKFYVEIKNPIEKWNVDFGVYHYIKYSTATIKFISDTGKTIIIGITRGKIYFNSPDNSHNTNYYVAETFRGSVSMHGNNVSFNVNGIRKTISVENFSKLKYVSIDIYDRYNYSTLQSLTIGSSN